MSRAVESVGLRQENRPGESRARDIASAEQPARRITTLQWAVGVFCVLLGALMLVAPHQFGAPVLAVLGGQWHWVGVVFLLAGIVLPGCVVAGASDRWTVVSHFAAAAALLLFLYNYVMLRLWVGIAIYAVLAAGVSVAPFATPWLERAGRRRGDFFALVIGADSVVLGGVLLLVPGQLGNPAYDPVRPYLWLYGVVFLAVGLGVLAAQLFSAVPASVHRAAHLAVPALYLPWAFGVSVPLLIWSGILFYGGFSLVIATLPWAGPRLRRLDPHSFSVRLAFLLTIAAAAPTIAIFGVMTSGQELQMRAETEAGMQSSAIALASDVSHYIGSYRASLAALAAQPGLLSLPVADQQLVLQGFHNSFPDAMSYGIYDAAGVGRARTDGRPLNSVSGVEVFEQARRTNGPSLEARMGLSPKVPVFAMGAAIYDPDGGFAGIVSAGIESSRMGVILDKVKPAPASRVYLVDAAGHIIVHPDEELVANFTDFSTTPPVSVLLPRKDDNGVVSYASPAGDALAAYARVPELGWSVVVDLPASSALAAVREGRNRAFALLLGIVLLAALAGSVVARQLTKPLAALGRAISQLPAGDGVAPLPASRSSEIQQLVSGFKATQTELATRTAEREQLLQEAQRRADELDASNRGLYVANDELEAFAYSVAHDLRSPVRHMDGFSKALMERHADKLDEQGKRYVQFVREGSVKMGLLIDDLLMLTGVARQKLRRTSIDLSEMARQVATDLRGQQPERQVEFVVASDIEAKGDSGLIGIALENLLGNAWKFTSRLDHARIEFGVLPLEGQKDGQTVYYVRDNGVGFNMAYADKLFRAFERLHGPDEFLGSGIGLATVERIIRRHGGRVWAEGEVGKGATFFFTLEV